MVMRKIVGQQLVVERESPVVRNCVVTKYTKTTYFKAFKETERLMAVLECGHLMDSALVNGKSHCKCHRCSNPELYDTNHKNDEPSM